MGDAGVEARKKTRKQQAEETKRHIFDVALTLLNQRDFETITVRDIVEAAQVSVGTFYNYYATKLDVFYETYQLADEYFEETVEPKLTQKTVRARLLCFFDEYARYSSEVSDLSLTKLLFNANNKCFDRPGTYGMRRVLEKQVRLGLENGELRAREGEDAEAISEFLMIATRGLVYNWCTRDGDYPLDKAMEGFVCRLLDAYR